MFERFRKVILTARLIAATGRVERQDGVIHLLADHLTDQSPRLRELTAEPDYFQPGDIAGGIARADEVKRPTADYREKAGEKTEIAKSLQMVETSDDLQVHEGGSLFGESRTDRLYYSRMHELMTRIDGLGGRPGSCSRTARVARGRGAWTCEGPG